MKKVWFSSLALIFAALSITAQAQMKYIAGNDYETLPAVIDDAQSPKVIEFFWYGCGHCNSVYPVVEQWLGPQESDDQPVESTSETQSNRWAINSRLFPSLKMLGTAIDKRLETQKLQTQKLETQKTENQKSDDIAFEFVPAMPSSRWATGGQLFYTAKALGMNINAETFAQVHNKNNPGIIFDEGKAKAFLVSQGADKEAVNKAWDSFGVKQDMERAIRLFNDSGLSGVPAFIVNGQYDVRYTGDDARFFDILDYVANLKE
ncbi:thiol:disulfide interchange protein DsbA/DsbL [Suttonella sp. R2A3]|uniref:thiol:disulfide interchange protein DsbA/DsbL n=1 Tax=Suttonella sp. R2A3 TaxID=2908648 RepID=UPI001F17B6FB|nr:thiol:disulfide interchange protein DsbA/DsbL [Suttonella sp. R2A3]UJF23883.1 thiol:disulfide interchange protein DsbA/DsbL [Suttonella sp. R2A3]